MTITVEIEATSEVDIDLSSEDIKEIIHCYNGDFKEWTRNNYSSWVCVDNMDFDIESINYDEDEAKKVLDIAKDVLCLDDNFNVNKQVAVQTLLKKHELITKPVNVTEFNVNIEQIALAFEFVDFNNPKTALNYIYLNGTDIVATDTKKMICINNHDYRVTNIFFPSYFILPMKNGAKCYFDANKTLYLEYQNCWYIGLDMNNAWNKKENYANYNDILRDMSNIKPSLEFKRFSSNSITRQVDDDVLGKLIEISVNDEDLYITEDHYNNLIDIHECLDECYFSENGVLFFYGENVKVAIMQVKP